MHCSQKRRRIFSLFFQKKKYIMSSIQSKSILLLLAHLSIHQSFVHLIVLNITFYFDSTSSKGTGIQYTPWIQKCQQWVLLPLVLSLTIFWLIWRPAKRERQWILKATATALLLKVMSYHDSCQVNGCISS